MFFSLHFRDKLLPCCFSPRTRFKLGVGFKSDCETLASSLPITHFRSINTSLEMFYWTTLHWSYLHRAVKLPFLLTQPAARGVVIFNLAQVFVFLLIIYNNLFLDFGLSLIQLVLLIWYQCSSQHWNTMSYSFLSLTFPYVSVVGYSGKCQLALNRFFPWLYMADRALNVVVEVNHLCADDDVQHQYCKSHVQAICCHVNFKCAKIMSVNPFKVSCTLLYADGFYWCT